MVAPMNMRLPLVAVLLSATACVSKSDYADALKSAADARAATQRTGAECDAKTALLNGKLRGLQASLDNQTAITGQLRMTLEDSGRSADVLLAEKGTLSMALNQSRARLEELRKAQDAADSRAALYRELAVKLERMIGAGEVSIGIREGRMVVAMPNDVLFDSGRTEIKRAGQAVLKAVASVLKTVPRRFQVAGHTDNVPIQTERFPSNWELASARALEVIRFMTAQGVAPAILSAAGYGEFDPVASNDTEDGRRRNRRIEITLQPNIDEIVAIPEAK